MKLYILGICGTFMGGVAALARELGHEVAGCDANVYPPMSTQLEDLGIELDEGWLPESLPDDADAYIVGNVVSRGNPVIEQVLNTGGNYMSGPEWLGKHLLADRHVIAVAGTHGKTSTSSMIAWILDQAGLEPGFLIGGVAHGLGVSAKLGKGKYFVVEADEYDTAFFDKRSKFVHYRPGTAVLNNLEYDHADIFPDIEAIKKQFHILVRTVPGNGRVIHFDDDENLNDTLQQGCWSEQQAFSATNTNAEWSAELLAADGSQFNVLHKGEKVAQVNWSQLGMHNVNNALAAVAAVNHAGVDIATAAEALNNFEGIRRRMDLRGQTGNSFVYDDFAHHPTEIATTVAGLRAKVGNDNLIAIVEPRSNSMRMGAHSAALAESLQQADKVFAYVPPEIEWDVQAALAELGNKCQIEQNFEQLLVNIVEATEVTKTNHCLVMSNGGFNGIHEKLLEKLNSAA